MYVLGVKIYEWDDGLESVRCGQGFDGFMFGESVLLDCIQMSERSQVDL